MPVFLPTTLSGAEQIVETISQLKKKESSEQLPPTETNTEDKKPGTLVGGLGLCSISLSQIAGETPHTINYPQHSVNLRFF